MDWAIGPNSFVIVGLLEADSFSRKEEVLKSLKEYVEMLESAAKSAPHRETQGTSSSQSKELEEADDEGKGKRKKRKEVESTGNKGAALLLTKLR